MFAQVIAAALSALPIQDAPDAPKAPDASQCKPFDDIKAKLPKDHEAPVPLTDAGIALINEAVTSHMGIHEPYVGGIALPWHGGALVIMANKDGLVCMVAPIPPAVWNQLKETLVGDDS